MAKWKLKSNFFIFCLRELNLENSIKNVTEFGGTKHNNGRKNFIRMKPSFGNKLNFLKEKKLQQNSDLQKQKKYFKEYFKLVASHYAAVKKN